MTLSQSPMNHWMEVQGQTVLSKGLKSSGSVSPKTRCFSCSCSLSCHCHQQLFLHKLFISPRSHLITLEVCVSRAAPPPDQTLAATTAPASHHRKPRSLHTLPGIFSLVFSSSAVHMLGHFPSQTSMLSKFLTI